MSTSSPAAGLPPNEVSPPTVPKSEQKRTVDDAALPEPQPQKLRSFSLTRPIQIQAPQPSSINSILREHSRTRLYVKPLYWTSQHLQLLNCQFVLENGPRPDESSSLEQRPKSGSTSQGKATGGRWRYANSRTEIAIRELVRCLLRPSFALAKARLILGLLKANGIHQHAR
ncbi:hypothetical protein N0V84_000976 [Fusarium piperis]|uniref:Uncharacterized protein n=1 Tax=Fusarium piperis TaxID=1435070 RepID=A0A9W8WM20_9HYPO|nr:hypothetical protein N0V84_000976 [Fusarium piperis]